MANPNLLPVFSSWTQINGGASTDMSTLSIAQDGRSCSFSVTHESSYIYYNLDALTDLKGHTLKLTVGSFTASDNEGWIRLRLYDAEKSTYVQTNFYTVDTSFPLVYDFEVPSDCGRIRLYFMHDYAASGIDPAALLSVAGVTLVDNYVASQTLLNFHKILEENLPSRVDPGTQHIYFTTDGSTVKQYIATNEGYLLPVGGTGGSGGSGEPAYTNAYTQDHIDERKDEIVALYNAGKCFAFAVATDIHVRIEDGDAGRYNLVRDYIMLSEQLPLDYILCEGDIMSYTQDWDGVFEPRIEKVKNIFNQARSPWWATRGNHDFNTDDHGFESNPNMLDWTLENIDKLFINSDIWHRSMLAQMNRYAGYDVAFDPGHEKDGYFYVDDAAHKHRIIVCNTLETMETEAGKPYINEHDEMDGIINGVETVHQVQWLAYTAFDMTGKTDWVVTLHGHYCPYSDAGTGNTSEFHGYATDAPQLRALIAAFQNGQSYSASYGVVNPVTHEWYNISLQKDYSIQGPISVVGWFSGHTHDDCYAKINGLNCLVSTCTCSNQRTSWTNDPTPTKLPPERNSTNLAMSVNVVIVNTTTKAVNVVKVGSKRNNNIKTSSDYLFTYN